MFIIGHFAWYFLVMILMSKAPAIGMHAIIYSVSCYYRRHTVPTLIFLVMHASIYTNGCYVGGHTVVVDEVISDVVSIQYLYFEQKKFIIKCSQFSGIIYTYNMLL